MPFDPFVPHSFSAPSIQRNAPPRAGLYGISNAREWIFIGETENIQHSLLNHLQEGPAALMDRGATGFVFELCTVAARPHRHDRLVFEYDPVCNRRAARS